MSDTGYPSQVDLDRLHGCERALKDAQARVAALEASLAAIQALIDKGNKNFTHARYVWCSELERAIGGVQP